MKSPVLVLLAALLLANLRFASALRELRLGPSPKTWEDAEEWCNGFQEHLVSVLTAEENGELVWFYGGPASSGWTGLNDRHGTFDWNDNSTYDFDNWAPFQPDNKPSGNTAGGAVGGADCVIITAFGWDDRNCGELYQFACLK